MRHEHLAIAINAAFNGLYWKAEAQDLQALISATNDDEIEIVYPPLTILDQDALIGIFLKALHLLRMFPTLHARRVGWALHTSNMMADPPLEGEDLIEMLADKLVLWAKVHT